MPESRRFGEMTRNRSDLGIQHDPKHVAGVTGCGVQDFDDALPIETVSTGNSLHCDAAQVAGLIQALQIELHGGCPVSGKKLAANFFYLSSPAKLWIRGARLHARMFF